MQPMANIAGVERPSISPWIVVAFIYYFLIGYFIYATLFAAIGSAVDQEADAAQLQTPITLPIIIPILFIFNVISNPDGTLAVVLSLIPFFTPILMIVRVAATDVPIWQIIASIVLTLGTFFACLTLAAKIYRTGILMYGKKPTFRDIFKWIRLAK
jgi:ABC-2 type transport system permease protein